MTKNRPKRVVYGLFFFLSIFLRTIVLDFPVAVSIKAWTASLINIRHLSIINDQSASVE